MGLYTLCLIGSGFLITGLYEFILSTYTHLHNQTSLPRNNNQTSPTRHIENVPTFSVLASLGYVFVSVCTFILIVNSLFSLINAYNVNDDIGFVYGLVLVSIMCVFELYGLLSTLKCFGRFGFPKEGIELVVVFGFAEELIFFYGQKKDPLGLENRYYDLLLVPVLVCFFSSILMLESGGKSRGKFPGLARGVGLILQGTWFIQMGVTFFTGWMSHGCDVHEKSRGNFTVKCKGHMEYHRSKAIATLQFNCHLAFMVVLIVGMYSFSARRFGVSGGGDYSSYKPISEELRRLEHQNQFTLDSDDDEGVVEEVGVKEMDVGGSLGVAVVNGFGAH